MAPDEVFQFAEKLAVLIFVAAMATGVAGIAFTVTAEVVLVQPVAVNVKVNVAEPDATPVTRPAFVTVAAPVLLLTQVPPVLGDNVVVLPTQIVVLPVILTVGNAFTVTAEVVLVQPVVVNVKVNEADPAATPVTTPALETVALV